MALKSASMTFNIHGHQDVWLSTIGHQVSSYSGNLFVSSSGIIPHSGNTNFFINGYEPKSALSCPILDPEASIQISDELISIYQSRIDAIINQLGKSVLLEYTPVRTPCINCEYEMIRGRSRGIYKIGGPRPFARGRQCSYCKGRGFLETSVQKCIRCLIQWNPQDAKRYGISVSDHKDIVRFKTYLYNFDELKRASFAIANYDIMSMVKLKVRLIQEPILVGLRESRYCISFWEMI